MQVNMQNRNIKYMYLLYVSNVESYADAVMISCYKENI